MAPLSRDRILETLFHAVDAVNPELPRGRKLSQDLDTALLGAAGALDSLGIVNLIVAVEQQVEEDFGLALTLLDAAELSPEESPLRSLGALADHLHSLLQERAA